MQTESTRQQKVARQIQKDISDIFTKEAASLLAGVMASVTVVRMSPDLGYARVYLSVFPFEKSAGVMERLEENAWLIRKALGTTIKHQLKSVPAFSFFVDDSLANLTKIEVLLNA